MGVGLPRILSTSPTRHILNIDRKYLPNRSPAVINLPGNSPAGCQNHTVKAWHKNMTESFWWVSQQIFQFEEFRTPVISVRKWKQCLKNLKGLKNMEDWCFSCLPARNKSSKPNSISAYSNMCLRSFRSNQSVKQYHESPLKSHYFL